MPKQVFLEPGEKFQIPYGTKGKSFEAVAMSRRQQREIMQKLSVADAALKVDVDAGVKLYDEIMKQCFPGITDEFLENESSLGMQQDLVIQALAGARLSEDQQKKSE